MTPPAAAGVNRVHCILINTVFAMPAAHPTLFSTKAFFHYTPFRPVYFYAKILMRHLTHHHSIPSQPIRAIA
jgi:hypothetical protein